MIKISSHSSILSLLKNIFINVNDGSSLYETPIIFLSKYVTIALIGKKYKCSTEVSSIEKINPAKLALQKVIYGQEQVIDLIFIALISGGHVLLDSVPGTGKTKLAKSFAKVIAGDYQRVQFTPDVLPSDVTGIRFFNPKTQTFEMRVGPVVCNVLLADEINRATPKTQSSLLEAMEEQQATIDGETISIHRPFIVLATQNPVESNYGTFPLPEAQLDRFLFKVDLSYPSLDDEREILRTYRLTDPYETLNASLSLEDIVNMQEKVKQITISETVCDYLLAIVRASRTHPDVEIGVSTRALLAFMRAAQARAFINDREYVTPDDIHALVPYIFEHRLVLTMEGSIKKTRRQIIEEILEQEVVPVEQEVQTK